MHPGCARPWVPSFAALPHRQLFGEKMNFSYGVYWQYHFSVLKFRSAIRIHLKQENLTVSGRMCPSLSCQLDTLRTASLSQCLTFWSRDEGIKARPKWKYVTRVPAFVYSVLEESKQEQKSTVESSPLKIRIIVMHFSSKLLACVLEFPRDTIQHAHTCVHTYTHSLNYFNLKIFPPTIV